MGLEILQSKFDFLNKHTQILTILWKAVTIQQLDILQTQSSINTVKEEMMQKELGAKQIKYAMARFRGLDSPKNLSEVSVVGNLPLPEIVSAAPEIWLNNHPLGMKFQKEYETELLMKKYSGFVFFPFTGISRTAYDFNSGCVNHFYYPAFRI